jgi:hypothetical protein
VNSAVSMTIRSQKIVPNHRSHIGRRHQSIGSRRRTRGRRASRVGKKAADVTWVVNMAPVGQHGQNCLIGTVGVAPAGLGAGSGL